MGSCTTDHPFSELSSILAPILTAVFYNGIASALFCWVIGAIIFGLIYAMYVWVRGDADYTVIGIISAILYYMIAYKILRSWKREMCSKATVKSNLLAASARQFEGGLPPYTFFTRWRNNNP